LYGTSQAIQGLKKFALLCHQKGGSVHNFVCTQQDFHKKCKSGMQVLLLDEITVDLDVLARANLLTYLKKECEERGATIIYATHIFDGLDDWPTDIVSFLARAL
jgi:ABC-type sugar transport system ATPase subunit